MTFAGLRSRWTMPRAWAAASARAICAASGERLAEPHAGAGDHRVERLALHVLHHDEVEAVGLGDVVDGDDVGVVERRGRLGLLHETPLALRVGHLVGGEDLDGDEAVEVGVAGLVDDAHAAFAELLEDVEVQHTPADHRHPRCWNAHPGRPEPAPVLPRIDTGLRLPDAGLIMPYFDGAPTTIASRASDAWSWRVLRGATTLRLAGTVRSLRTDARC